MPGSNRPYNQSTPPARFFGYYNRLASTNPMWGMTFFLTRLYSKLPSPGKSQEQTLLSKRKIDSANHRFWPKGSAHQQYRADQQHRRPPSLHRLSFAKSISACRIAGSVHSYLAWHALLKEAKDKNNLALVLPTDHESSRVCISLVNAWLLQKLSRR